MSTWTKFIYGLIATIICLVPSTNVRAQEAPANTRYTLSLEALGYRQDRKATGVVSELVYNLSIPRSWEPVLPSLDLHFSHSSLLLPEYSHMTIFYNDIPLADVPLTERNALSGRVRLTVPSTVRNGGQHRLRIVFHHRLHEDECADTDNAPALWSVIHKDSTITLDASLPSLDLALFPEPFSAFKRQAVRPVDVQMVLPPDPSDAQLRAATLVSAKIGQRAGVRDLDLSLGLGELPPTGHSIAIGSGAQLQEWLAPDLDLPVPLNEAGQFVETDGTPVADEAGVIQLVGRDDGSALLLVSGTTEAAQLRAALALADGNSLALMAGTYAIIHQDPQALTSLYEEADPFSLEGLTGQKNNGQVRGITIDKLRYCFRVPPDVDVQQGADIDLQYVFSPLLWDERSSMTVSFNKVNLVTVMLEEKEPGVQHLPVTLPAHEFFYGYNCMEVEFTLRLSKAECSLDLGGESWAEVYSSSPLTLTYTVATEPLWQPDLLQYPYPLNTSDDLSDVQIVLPDEPTPADIRGAMWIAARLGGDMRTETLGVDTITGANWDAKRDGSNHLIIIGGSGRNSAAAELQYELDISESADQEEAQEVGSTENEADETEQETATEVTLRIRNEIMLRQRSGAPLAAVEMLHSPWQIGRGVLHVTSSSDRASEYLFRILSNNPDEETFNGNISTVTEAGVVHSIDTLSRPERPSERFVNEEGQVVLVEKENPAAIGGFVRTGAMVLGGVFTLALGSLGVRFALQWNARRGTPQQRVEDDGRERNIADDCQEYQAEYQNKSE